MSVLIGLSLRISSPFLTQFLLTTLILDFISPHLEVCKKRNSLRQWYSTAQTELSEAKPWRERKQLLPTT